jgi:CBS domain-containing protein
LLIFIDGKLVDSILSMATTIFVGKLMTQNLETIGTRSSAQEASKKMRNNNVSSLVVIDDSNNKPIGIVTEHDLVRKVCANDTSSNSSSILIKNVMSSSPLVTIDARLPFEEAADVMIQNKVRHLLVVENNDINKPLGIVTSTDFVAYLKENLNVNEANERLIESLKGGQEDKEEEKVVKELEQEGKLKKNSQKGGQEYEDEEPRQG